jgi:hypothetical protein
MEIKSINNRFAVSSTIVIVAATTLFLMTTTITTALAQQPLTSQKRHQQLVEQHQRQQQQAQAQPQQQPLTPPPPPTTTTTTTTAAAATLPPENRLAILTAEDPAFATFKQISDDCMNRITYGNVTITTQQCELSLQQGADRWCGFEQYHQEKCEYASGVARAFKNFNNDIAAIFGEGTDIPALGELFPDLLPPTP